MRWLPVLVASLAFALVAASAAPARNQVSLERRGTLAQQVLDELNRVRSAHGLPRVGSQAGLRQAAVEHSRAMLTEGFFAHESPDGTSFDQRIKRFYPSHGWRTWSVGETLLSTSAPALGARGIVAAWLDSPSHRAVILTASWRRVGISAFYRPDAPGAFGGAESVAVTADFGLRQR